MRESERRNSGQEPSSCTQNAKTGPHHHGELETVLYIIRGRARFRWGDRLEFVDEAGPGDFIYVPPFVPHQELNARRDQPVEAVVVRSGQEPIVVNLDIPSPESGPISPQPDPFTLPPENHEQALRTCRKGISSFLGRAACARHALVTVTMVYRAQPYSVQRDFSGERQTSALLAFFQFVQHLIESEVNDVVMVKLVGRD